MPAQSPTLSPTLSAMVAGLRGSSSGMPASTLPTRSAPTSAPLVKMPPPRRAKIEAAHQKAGHRARAEGDVEAAGERFRRRLGRAHVGAHRDVHADEAGGAAEDGADRKADRHRPRQKKPETNEDDDSDAGDGHILAPEIGLRPLPHRRGNLLHPLRAGVRRHQAIDRVDAIDDREEPTDDYQAQKHGEKPRWWATGGLPQPVSGRLLPETAPYRNAAPGVSARFQTKVALRPPAAAGSRAKRLAIRRFPVAAVSTFEVVALPGRFADAQRLGLKFPFGLEQIGARSEAAVLLLHADEGVGGGQHARGRAGVP